MTNDELKQLISVYIDGEATPQEEDIVLNALKESQVLRDFYNDLLAMRQSLQQWPDDSLSPDLEQTIRKKITKQEEQKMKTPRWIPMGATIAVAVLVLVYSQIYVKLGVQGRLRQASDDIGEQYAVPQTVSTQAVDWQQPETQVTSAKTGKDATLAYQTKSGMRVARTDGYKAMSGRTEEKIPKESYEPYYLDAAYPVAKSEGKLHNASPSSTRASMVVSDVQYEYWGGEPKEQEAQPFIQIFQSGRASTGDFNTEQYDYIPENEFMNVAQNPLSTFSIDVDTASYANLRRFLANGQCPPADAVRIEEMVNYFIYDYPQPTGEDPFSVNLEVATCPWNPKHQLAMIGLQGRSLTKDTIPESNLVFLIDVSGSMNQADKIELLKDGFKMMVNQLRPEEKISIVTYAGNAAVLLDSVSGAEKQKILSAIDQLNAGGSTAGAQGILTAYELARKNFIPGGNNRVILATDGDFNIGVSSDGELVRLIEERRKDGIFLTVLGFGMGNYKDGKMEKLADKGNGNYYYIDTELEAKKVMVRELGSTLFTIAKDVKLQIEFNPAQVKAYRLIGYENRKLNKEDFNDDTKDAGELGAGHTVTAFYEIIPASSEETLGGSVDPLKYQQPQAAPRGDYGDEIMTVKLRYKKPNEEVSQLIEKTVTQAQVTENPSENFRFASAVAEFGMLLRNSQYKGEANFQSMLGRAKAAQGSDEFGYRQELIGLAQKAATLMPETYSTGYGVKGVK